ncbi:MAG: hypothetical protein LBU16_06365 [Treponema sp.]|jgi:hypothetical protein|nr:hypothetical protein [Treponema sp.]
MSLFCFLWIPLFYLFWRSIAAPGTEGSGEIWALLLGSVVAFARFLLGSFISPGAFGLFRWLSGCVDIVALPAILPLAACALLVRLRILAGAVNYANFALLWLIPGAAMRAVGWSALNDPLLLVLTPVLWTAIAAGVPLFIAMMGKSSGRLVIPQAAAIAALPLLAAAVYWAFFSQRNWLGLLLLVVALTPLGASAAANCSARSGRGLA